MMSGSMRDHFDSRPVCSEEAEMNAEGVLHAIRNIVVNSYRRNRNYDAGTGAAVLRLCGRISWSVGAGLSFCLVLLAGLSTQTHSSAVPSSASSTTNSVLFAVAVSGKADAETSVTVPDERRSRGRR